jgi:hypothetical protein
MTVLQPRAGILGSWDRLVGPGMTGGETVLVLGTSALAAALVAIHAGTLGFGLPLVLLAAFIAADVIGGAVCTMTCIAKRWHHRPGQRPSDHLGFIALHLLHVAVVAWAFRGEGFDLAFALTIGGWLGIAALIVVRAPRVLRSPLAAAAFVVALGLSLYALGPTPGLEWFVPLLFLKLLLGHAVPPLHAEG